MKKLLFTIFLSIFLLLPVGAGAATYYVSAEGDDSDGSTWDKAYNDIADINALNLANDDEVHFRAGDTFDDATGYSDAPYYGHLPDAGGTYYLLYDPDLETLYRGSHPQAYGDGSAALIANDATLEDGDSNALATDFSGLGVDLDGTGTITWGAATTIIFPTDVAKPSLLVSQVENEVWQYLEPITDNVDITVDGVLITSEHGGTVINTGTLIFTGDNNTIRCITFSGGVTDNGAGNVYSPVCGAAITM